MPKLTPDEILNLFYEDAREFLAGIEADLLTLEQEHGDSDSAIVDKIFRAVHTVKGGSYCVGLNKIGVLAHALENALDLARTGKLNLNESIVTLLLAGIDKLNVLVYDRDKYDETDTSEVINDIENELSLNEKNETGNPEITSILVPGNLILTTAKSLKEELVGHVSGGVKQFEIDMGKVKIIDSSGIGVLIMAMNSLSPEDGKIRLSNVSCDILKMLAVMNLDKHFNIVNSK